MPDQSGVTQATPRNYWLGAISSWGIDLVKRGYQVATNIAPLTYGDDSNANDLSKWDVLIVDEPNTRFTAAESTAVVEFVRNGGGLVAVVDHDNSDRNNDGYDSPKIWNALDAQMLWGIHCQSTGETNNNITQDSGNVETSPSDSIIHGPNGVADSLSFHNGTTFVLHPENNPRVRGLVWMKTLAHGNSGVMAARTEYGNGRIVFVGDSSPADDGSAAPGNSSIFDGWAEVSGRDSLLFQNATVWATRRDAVAGVPTPHSQAGLRFLAPVPNPSARIVTLRFTLPRAMRARLEIVDASGRRVRSVAFGILSGGDHAWRWDGRDDGGMRVPNGVYTTRLTTPSGMVTGHVVRMR